MRTCSGCRNTPAMFFTPSDVDAVLPADGGVRLGQERGRHEAEPDAPHVGRGRESGEVADDPAADPRHEGGAVQLEVEELPVQTLHGPEVLRRFARLDLDDRETREPAPVTAAGRSCP